MVYFNSQEDKIPATKFNIIKYLENDDGGLTIVSSICLYINSLVDSIFIGV